MPELVLYDMRLLAQIHNTRWTWSNESGQLWSEADRLIHWQYVRGLVEEVRARDEARVVRELCLDQSGHVAHLKIYPDLYTQTVARFLQSL